MGTSGEQSFMRPTVFDHAVALAKKSPGLKHGFTHEVFQEISLRQAAHEKVSD